MSKQELAAVSMHAAFAKIRSGLADIERGVERIAEGVRAVIEAHGAAAREVLQGEFPSIKSSFWRAVIAVAEGKLHPRVVATGCDGLRYLERLPLEDQARAVSEGVPVSVPGTQDHRLVPAYLLTPHEIARAISPSGSLRTLAEQAAFERAEREAAEKRRQEWLASLREEKASQPDEESQVIQWRVEGNRVRVLACPVVLTKEDLRKLLRSIA
jgi:hypothetical protein